jgi:hypothetical protein
MNIGTFALTLLLAITAIPATATGIIPNSPKPEAGPSYDPATVIDIMGTITDVWEVPPYLQLEGLHLAVKSGSETLDVYVGPADFVEIFGVMFVKGDKIEVIGSRLMFGDGEIVLAAEIRIADVTVVLRDKDGVPYWAMLEGLRQVAQGLATDRVVG